MDNNNIVIGKDDCGQRFDKFLLRRFDKAGKGLIYKLLRKKRIKLNGKRAAGNEILLEGDVVTFYVAPQTQTALARPPKLITNAPPLAVLYEDDNALIVNKPAGMLTHPDLTDAALYRAQKKGAAHFAPAAVNRLDRNTSGIVVLAKNLYAAREFSKALRERSADKYYLTAVAGIVTEKFTVTDSLVKDKNRNTVSICAVGGESAVTEVTPLGSVGGVSVLSVKLVTGRSHQIRAHLQSTGNPIIGDPKYGKPIAETPRQALPTFPSGNMGSLGRELEPPAQEAVRPPLKNLQANFLKQGSSALLDKNIYNARYQLLHAWKLVFHGLDGRLKYLNDKEFVCPPEGLLAEIYSSVVF